MSTATKVPRNAPMAPDGALRNGRIAKRQKTPTAATTAEVVAARSRVPSLSHGRRFELVEPLAEPSYLHAVRGSL